MVGSIFDDYFARNPERRYAPRQPPAPNPNEGYLDIKQARQLSQERRIKAKAHATRLHLKRPVQNKMQSIRFGVNTFGVRHEQTRRENLKRNVYNTFRFGVVGAQDAGHGVARAAKTGFQKLRAKFQRKQ